MPASRFALIHCLVMLCVSTGALAQERAPDGRARNPGLTTWCETPVASRKADLGCYTTAITNLGVLPAGPPLYWHLDDRSAAEANGGPMAASASKRRIAS